MTKDQANQIFQRFVAEAKFENPNLSEKQLDARARAKAKADPEFQAAWVELTVADMWAGLGIVDP